MFRKQDGTAVVEEMSRLYFPLDDGHLTWLSVDPTGEYDLVISVQNSVELMVVPNVPSLDGVPALVLVDRRSMEGRVGDLVDKIREESRSGK